MFDDAYWRVEKAREGNNGAGSTHYPLLSVVTLIRI